MELWTNAGWDVLFARFIHDGFCVAIVSVIVSMTIVSVSRLEMRSHRK